MPNDALGSVTFSDGDLFNALRESVAILAPDGSITALNRPAEALYGWTSEEAIGRSVASLTSSSSPVEVTLLRRAREFGRASATMTRGHASGKPVTVSTQVTARRDAAGQLIGFFETTLALRDDGESAQLSEGQSDRTLSGERYRDLFHHTPLALCQLDETATMPFFQEFLGSGQTDVSAYLESHPGTLVWLLERYKIVNSNRYSMEMFEAREVGDMLGPTGRFWNEEGRGTVARCIAARLRGEASYREDTKMVTLRGRVIDVRFGCDWLMFPDGQHQVLLSFEDIGERVKAQQTLNRVQADFAHAARISMLGELTASIAHEVNQPLGAIVANGQAGLRWLQREVPDIEHALESTTDMIADARRASDIIGRIRAMAVNRTPKRERLNLIYWRARSCCSWGMRCKRTALGPLWLLTLETHSACSTALRSSRLSATCASTLFKPWLTTRRPSANFW
ncbi:PAS domain S-box protein [Devosia sp. ZW T5_3]|uniref:PAS domain S-box protein n=1 Tax=Devosia sp. ZW T5_3 TaxID=3378085 RepID=UPI0038526CB2